MNKNNLILALLITVMSLTVFTMGFTMSDIVRGENKTPGTGSKHIKTEYYLEISEDSIWIESPTGKVYSGVYSDLDSLILIDNL